MAFIVYCVLFSVIRKLVVHSEATMVWILMGFLKPCICRNNTQYRELSDAFVVHVYEVPLSCTVWHNGWWYHCPEFSYLVDLILGVDLIHKVYFHISIYFHRAYFHEEYKRNDTFKSTHLIGFLFIVHPVRFKFVSHKLSTMRPKSISLRATCSDNKSSCKG